MPKVVIRHKIRGTKKAQTRLRKNEQQNKILANEFQKNPIWTKAKIAELQALLGLKTNQIYKWNWDMQRKLAEHKGGNSDASITAPDISDHISGRKVSDWTGDLGDEVVDDVNIIEEFASSHPHACGAAQSHQDVADNNKSAADDDVECLMSEVVAGVVDRDAQQQLEVHSQAAPQSATTPLVTCD